MDRHSKLLIQGAVEQALPAQLSPMLLVSQKQPFTREGWTFEPKLDGMRAIAIIQGGKCRLLSRSGRDITRIFPSIAAALAVCKGELVLDSEIVAHDAQGRVDFEGLQSRWMLSHPREISAAENKSPTAMYAFDAIHADGYDLSKCRLIDRKSLLFNRVTESKPLKLVSTFDDGIALFNACKEQQLEGIVAKKQSSIYRSGERSKDWIKIKFTQTEQLVVVGHRKDEGILIAQNTAQGLHIAGVVQYGFTNANYQLLITKLKLKDFKRETSTVYFEPTVWVNVEFMQWTSRRQLRFPVFRGLVDR